MESSVNRSPYEIILDKIINCEYAPGRMLTEEQLVELTGVSRTPVREAVQKLQENRLVKILPKKGIKVLEINDETIREIYEVRKAIEPFIIRTHASSIDPEKLRNCYDRIVGREEITSDFGEDFKADDDLHSMILRSSGNEYIITLCDQMFMHSHRMRVFVGLTDEQRVPRTRLEHAAILEKLIEKDYEEAANLMLAHLNSSEEGTYKALRKREEVIARYVL